VDLPEAVAADGPWNAVMALEVDRLVQLQFFSKFARSAGRPWLFARAWLRPDMERAAGG
jgi:hypothetical protein